MPSSRRAKWISFLRVLWPSWRFFDSADANAYLFYRVRRGAAGTWAEWTPVPRAAPLGPLAWVWNPRGNGELAAGATVEGLLREAERSPPELESSVAYQLVAKYLQRRVPELSAAGVSFQFKICYVKCGPGALTPGEDALISKTHVGGEVFA